MPTDKTFNIFIAYSRKDSEYLDEIRTHLTPLERTGKVTIWYDGKIEPGAVWETEIKERLHTADIILLLVSASAIASDYFYDKEMKDALERHRFGTTKVVPFILRPCAWKATPLAKLQVIPKDGKAASTWNDRDEAYSDAVNSLWEMVTNMEQRRLKSTKAEKETKEQQQQLKEEAEAKRKADEKELRLKKEADAKKQDEKEKRLKKETEAKEKAEHEKKLTREAEAKRKAEEERKLKEQAEAKRQKEERKVKEQHAAIKNADPPGKDSDKNTKEASQKIAKYKTPLIITGTIVVLAIVLWVAFNGGNNSSNDAGDNPTGAAKDSVETSTVKTVPKISKDNPPIAIGKKYQGGIIFYIDNTGQHGLIAAKKDIDGKFDWDEAKQICAALGDGWRLPTNDELEKLYQNRDKVGGFGYGYYWSSSETRLSKSMYSWARYFNASVNSGFYFGKSATYRVRAVRAF